MRISRRTFIKTGAAGAAGLVISGGLGVWYQDEIGVLQASEVVQYLRGNFSYLPLEISDAEISQFYVEYAEWYKPVVRDHWQRLIKGRGPEVFRKDMDHLATTFLMSTNFFVNGEDESKTVKYICLYAPYKNSCWNPVAQLAFRQVTAA